MKRNKKTKWLQLFFGFALLGIFAFIIIPLISEIPLFKKVVEHNRSCEIEAGTLFYTETSQFSEADNYMSNSNKYNPQEGK